MFIKQSAQKIIISTTLFLCSLPIQASTETIAQEEVQHFSDALYLIRENYVSKINHHQLFENAIRGMVNGLDPQSTYLDKEAMQEMAASSANFASIGLEITQEESLFKVITPIIGSPAYIAGIKPGDYIIKLNGNSTQGLSLTQAAKSLQGEAGSMVQLVIIRKGLAKPLFFSLKREKPSMDSVFGEHLSDELGYIRLSQFQAFTAKDMREAIAKLEQQHPLNGLILDLRNNPGGAMDSAIMVADAFIDQNQKNKEKLIVSTKGRLPQSNVTAHASAGDLLNNKPLIVLINGGSASAAEIVAGALKDNHRALIVGTTSFGKGSVQTIFPLDASHAIQLTTALYYTPSGKSIQAHGIEPDIIINEMKITAEKDPALHLNEADLKGHLQNNNPIPETPQANKKISPLLVNDYQLSSAFTILRGLAVLAKPIH